jgi:diguanylate cyclase (GGDEF)-like protein
MGSDRPASGQLSLRAAAAGPSARHRLGRPALGRSGIALVLAWLTVMVVAGWVLAASQQRSRDAMAGRLEARTKYAATFISIYTHDLLVRERSAAESWLGTTRVSPGTLERAASALGLSGAVLLDAHDHALAVPTRTPQPLEVLLVRRNGGMVTAGDGPGSRVALLQVAGAPMIVFALRYPTASGPRVFAGALPVADTVLPAALDHIVTTRNWQGYLIDPTGARLAAGRPGSAHPGDLAFRSAVAGTPWRIVIKDPPSELYSYLNGAGRWFAWLALTGLAIAGLAIILLIAGLSRKRTQLTELNDELARLAAVDPLTGLRNRRAIEESLHDALSAARRHALALSVLVVDIDRFKTFNDRLGHRGGDDVLVHTARVLDARLRAEDAIGRWGGEEFLVVLPGTDEEGAVHATERLRAALAADQPDLAAAHGLPVTVTIGVAEWQQEEEMGELVNRADRALYAGKAAGRDRARVSAVMAAITDVPGPS